MHTKIGTLILGDYHGSLCLCDWYVAARDWVRRGVANRLKCEIRVGNTDLIGIAKTQIEEYLNGDRRHFDVPITMSGTTFQMEVWKHLLEIPYGSFTTYGKLASDMGRPTAVRAVAAAARANPISIIVPCHRLIGANSSLTGYAGGLDAKRILLDLEK